MQPRRPSRLAAIRHTHIVSRHETQSVVNAVLGQPKPIMRHIIYKEKPCRKDGDLWRATAAACHV